MHYYRVLVSGGRTLSALKVWEWLAHHALETIAACFGVPEHETRIVAIIEGNQTGADEGAGLYAISLGERNCVHCQFPAAWIGYGADAGTIRNTEMIVQGRPDIGLIFPGYHGTADMAEQLTSYRIPYVNIPSASVI